MDPTQRFSGRASDYSAYRPGYPSALLELLSHDLPHRPGHMTAIDIGAGTGISAALLASAGWRVIGVEPNEDMRLQSANAASSAVTFVAGTAESTGLHPGCADLVTAFQSFHWFNTEPALAEFHRLLFPGGRVALIWNVRDLNDRFTAAYSRIVGKHAKNSTATELQHKEASGLRLLESRLFTNGRGVSLPNSQSMDLDALLGRVRSTSYLPNSGPAYDALARDLSKLFERSAADGQVQMIYQTLVFLAERPA